MRSLIAVMAAAALMAGVPEAASARGRHDWRGGQATFGHHRSIARFHRTFSAHHNPYGYSFGQRWSAAPYYYRRHAVIPVYGWAGGHGYSGYHGYGDGYGGHDDYGRHPSQGGYSGYAEYDHGGSHDYGEHGYAGHGYPSGHN